VTITGALMIPIEPGWRELTARAFVVYLPLDALTYLAILALGAASDVERQRRAAVQREQALRADVLDARLAALRARLNPHFLFNALNSVAVLARAGKTEETGGVIEGLTALLRYVLDDRRSALVRLDLIRELRADSEYTHSALLSTGERVPVSRDRRKGLEKALLTFDGQC
jgi:LytS/YehU family sensor histidine kinase